MRIRRTLGFGLAALALTAVSACGNSSGSGNNGSGNGSGSGDKGSITISGQNFGEMQIMAAMYGDLLTNAGYTVTTKLVDTRDIYIPQLTSGKVTITPDYLGALADYLQAQQNGANAPIISTHSPQTTLSRLKPLAQAAGIAMLNPAKATDQNAFAVTKTFASAHNLTTLSDLGAAGLPIVLAAPADCQGRSDCQKGLADTYGIHITKIIPLDFDSTQVVQSLTSGESQLGEVATTDGALDQEGLVALTDDKGIQPAENLIPAVNAKFLAAHPDVATILNKLSATLTTADLAALDLKLAVNREQPSQIADDYLKSKGLISGTGRCGGHRSMARLSQTSVTSMPTFS